MCLDLQWVHVHVVSNIDESTKVHFCLIVVLLPPRLVVVVVVVIVVVDDYDDEL